MRRKNHTIHAHIIKYIFNSMSSYFFENSQLTFHQYILIRHFRNRSTFSFYNYSQMYIPFSFSSRIPTVLLLPEPRKVIADTNDSYQCL
jgi:hypothetical protein